MVFLGEVKSNLIPNGNRTMLNDIETHRKHRYNDCLFPSGKEIEMSDRQLAFCAAAVAVLALVIACGGAVRGCSNDFDRRMGNPETFERWAW